VCMYRSSQAPMSTYRGINPSLEALELGSTQTSRVSFDMCPQRNRLAWTHRRRGLGQPGHARSELARVTAYSYRTGSACSLMWGGGGGVGSGSAEGCEWILCEVNTRVCACTRVCWCRRIFTYIYIYIYIYTCIIQTYHLLFHTVIVVGRRVQHPRTPRRCKRRANSRNKYCSRVRPSFVC